MTNAVSAAADELVAAVDKAIDGARDFLVSDEGRRARRIVATTLIAGAPMITRLPIVRRTLLGRAIAMVGGAAAVIKAAEFIRDWEPAGH